MTQAVRAGDDLVRQKWLGSKGLVAFLTVLSAFVALSTDIYLPALPSMTKDFGVPEYQTNLTLTLFFVFYAVAILVWGPLSDRYGRRPILLVGLSSYTVAGALCAIAPSIYLLMLFRIMQAVGAGAATAVATAIVKDVYRGRRRESTLAAIQSMTVISPAVAPMLGALLLNLTSWRGTFWAQAGLGVLVLAMTVAFEETLQARNTGSPLASLRRLGVVLKHRTFAYLLLIFSPVSIFAMAFVSSSSYVYQETFGVSSQVFSYFFAIFAVGLAIGPVIYIRLSRSWRRTSIVTGCFAVIALGGVLILLVGARGPWAYILAVLPSSIALSCMRPPAVYLMLDQHEADAGSVSALMSSSHMVMGSIGMVIVSLPLLGGRVEILGVLTLVVGLLSGGLWLGIGQPRIRAASKRA
jgi:DHA1 family bicyclomycin/chloramphenicol resistance-like MFS transporter